MKNTLNDLNNYLFEAMERINDDELSVEELEKEITRSRAITDVAEKIIQSGELSLKTFKYLAEYDLDQPAVPTLLASKKS